MSDFSNWIGRTQERHERCDAWPLKGLLALLDLGDEPQDGGNIPALAHWLYFAPTAQQQRIGVDGHPERGDFLPPLSQSRRMWAASDITFEMPLRLGDQMRKFSSIEQIAEKAGKSGTLVFVTVKNVYEVAGRRALVETQTLVYRDDPAPGEAPPPPKPAPTNPAWSVRIDPDPVLLFRYSAVTFNAHRIHYDAPYARDVEGYEGPVVHGQLTATLMLKAFLKEHPEARLTRFSFRAVRPLFSSTPYFVEGAPGEGEGSFQLWARDSVGNLAMSANVEVAA